MIPSWLKPKDSKASTLEIRNIKHHILQEPIGISSAESSCEYLGQISCGYRIENAF